MASSDDVHVIKAQGDVAAPSKAAALSRQVHWVAGQKQRAESVSEFRVLRTSSGRPKMGPVDPNNPGSVGLKDPVDPRGPVDPR